MTTETQAVRRMNLPLQEVDPEIAEILRDEARRQATGLELIPSENFVSEAVLEAMGSVFTNKYSEGYPGRRYYAGKKNTDRPVPIPIDRANAPFAARHAELQADSGTQPNIAAYMSPLQPSGT